MPDLRPVWFLVGALLAGLALAMALPAVVDAARGGGDWRAFAVAGGIVLFVAVVIMLGTHAVGLALDLRQALLLVVFGWMALALAAALPLYLSRLGLTFVDALFESMSGITSTGATVLRRVEDAPAGILLWRALLNWAGGLGIVIVAIAVLPLLRVGGMQLFRSDAFDRPERLLPGAIELGANIGAVYLVATALGAGALWAAGMPRFDAVVHAMSAIGTGGFSTHNAQIAAFAGPAIPWILIALMLAGCLPFVLYVEAVHGRAGKLARDSQVRWFLLTVAGFAAAMVAWLVAMRPEYGLGRALTEGTFAVVSIISGTGFVLGDYTQWGDFAPALLFLLMFVGGCAGSTACGIKIFRFQVAFVVGREQVHKLIEPRGVFVPQYNRQPVTDEIASSVMGFFFLFVAAYGALALGLAAFGLDLVTALSGAAAVLGNVGPGFGATIGPAGNYASLPDGAKWLMAAGMLVGRLEVFTVFVLLGPAFWKG